MTIYQQIISHFSFLSANQNTDLAFQTNYDPVLVLLSVMIVYLGAYTSLSLLSMMAKSQSSYSRLTLLLSASLALSVGIFSMHFIGMQALILPVSYSYNTSITLLSIIPSFIASLIGLNYISISNKHNHQQKFIAALFIGSGIGLMHYLGMSAMLTDGQMLYHPYLFVISIVATILLALVAIESQQIINIFYPKVDSFPAKLIKPLIISLAISGMHYSAIQSTYFFPSSYDYIIPEEITHTSSYILYVMVLLLIIMTLITLYIDRHNNKKLQIKLLSPSKPQTKKIFITIYFYTVLFITFLAILGYYFHVQETIKDEKFKSQAELKLIENKINYIFLNVFDNIKLVLYGIPLEHYITEPDKLSKDALISQFKTILSPMNTPFYKLRFIDHNGMERVKVERKAQGQINKFPEAELQDKSARNYVLKGEQLSREQVYISAFNLNREHGVIEKPIRPVIRFVVPVFNFNNQRIGMLVFSLIGESIRKLLKDALINSNHQVYLLEPDSAGHYIFGPSKEFEWGQYLNHKHSFSSQYPAIWKQVLSHDNGLLNNHYGHFRYATINPQIENNSHFSTPSKRQWKLLIAVPGHHFWSISHIIEHPIYAIFLTFIYILSAIVCWYIAKMIIAKRQSEKDSKDFLNEIIQLNQVMEKAPSGILVVSHDGFIEYANQAFSIMSGYDIAELIGNNPNILKSAEHPAEFYQTLWSTIMAGNIWRGKIRNKRKDGSLFWVDNMIAPVQGKNYSIEQFFCIAYDITKEEELRVQMLKTERNQRQTQEQMNAILNNMSSPIWLQDVSGRYLYASHPLLKFLGLKLEEIQGKSNSELYPEDIALKLSQHTIQTLQSGISKEYDIILPGCSGNKAYMLTQFPINLSESKQPLLCTIATDISKHKEMEQQLLTALSVAESATQAKSNFLANMSHEVRTPMNAIVGLSHLALQTKLSPKQHDYLQKILGSSNNLLGIINDILDFSKIEAGKLDIESIPFLLTTVLEQNTTLLAPMIVNKNLELLIDIPTDIPNELIGDPLRLGQIITNLTNNAVKFTSEGEVVLKVRLGSQNNKQIRLDFTVIDSGIGMTQIQQQSLFQAFTQADSSTTRKFGGTGLGLMISKQLIELMGGKIGVKSKKDIGTSFYFHLWLKKDNKPQLAKQTNINNLSQFEGSRILIVDDNLVSTEIINIIVQSYHFETVLANSGKEAVQLLAEAEETEHYDLIILDWKMPELDGIETLQRIRGLNNSFAKIPVILISSFDIDTLKQSAQGLNVEDFLRKPLFPSTLLDKILKALSHNAPAISESLLDKEQTLETDIINHIKEAHILLVEDNMINQQVAQELLEHAGLNISIANNGREAVSMVQQHSYDAVLMDVQMPVMGGIEASQIIRKMKKNDDLPIIAMTASAMHQDREDCINAGMNDHISKPVSPQELYTVLNHWVKPGEREACKIVHQPKEEASVFLSALNQKEFDVSGALTRLNGKEALYHRILLRFMDKHTNTVVELRKQLQQQEYQKAIFTAHTFKGVSATIGAIKLQQYAGEIEHALKNQELEVESLLEQLQQHLSQCVTSIHLVLTQINDSPNPNETISKDTINIDFNTVQSLLEELYKQIKSYHANSIHTAKELKDKLHGTPYYSIAAQLVIVLEDYDFDSAQEQAQQLEKELLLKNN